MANSLTASATSSHRNASSVSPSSTPAPSKLLNACSTHLGTSAAPSLSFALRQNPSQSSSTRPLISFKRLSVPSTPNFYARAPRMMSMNLPSATTLKNSLMKF
jgi:hypothetical protein